MVMVVAALLVSATMSLVQAQCAGKVPFKVNMNQLSSYLDLAPYQEASVAGINARFIEKQKKSIDAGYCSSEAEMEKVVSDNLKLMKQVLAEGQYRKYVTLVNVTNNNNRLLRGVALTDVYMVNKK